MKTPRMAEQALAGEIVAALLADEKDGGYDLTAGMFGPNFSTLVRRWVAAEWMRSEPPPTNTLHTFGYDANGNLGLRASRTSFDPNKDHQTGETARMFREAVVERKQTNIDPFVLWKHIMGFEWVMTGKIELGEIEPINMLLYCPNCGTKHVDKDNHEELTIKAAELGVDREGDRAYSDWLEEHEWNNPPHRSHLCHSCGCVWRPADVPTNGVDEIKTEGKRDTWPAVHNEEVTAAPAKADRELQVEQKLASLIDLICPNLDSGDILADAEEAMRKVGKPVQAEAPELQALLLEIVGLSGRPDLQLAASRLLATQPPAIPAAPAVQASGEREHAENYKLIRRGQHWSVIDGMGNTLRGDDLDAAVDAIRARICAAIASPPASGAVERPVMEDALKGLEYAKKHLYWGYTGIDRAIERLRAALATQPLEQKPVHQWRKKGSMSNTWHDGHPDPEDGGGPYETRTLFGKAQPEQVAQDSADPELTVEAFTARLARHMEIASLTAKDVSDLTGVSETTLSRLKNHGRMPDALSYAALCNMMGWHPYLKHKMAAGRVRAARASGQEKS